jgi:hypothetical protein
MLAGLTLMVTFGNDEVAVGTVVDVSVIVDGTVVALGVPGKGVCVTVEVEVGTWVNVEVMGTVVTGVGVNVDVKIGVEVGGVGDNGVGVAVELLVCRIVRL